nr:glycosyltransferase family 4 protein [uncultured Vibrio sp.]
MAKLLVLSKYSRLGASSRLRTQQYIPYLNEAGFDVTVSSLYDDDYLKCFYRTGKRSILKIAVCYMKRIKKLLSAGEYDLLVIEKEVLPYIPYFLEKMFLKKYSYIVDYDDAIFHSYDLSRSSLVRFLLGNKIKHIMNRSNAVLVGNNYLRSYAEYSKSKLIVEIPTVIDESRYEKKENKELTDSEYIVGWIGSPFTQKYILGIKNDLLAAQKLVNFKLFLVGASENIIQDLEGLNVEVFDWSEDTEVNLIQSMDIGIMPLPNEPFEQGKCGYKLIQYMACGVPVIGSDVGVNRSIIERDSCGIVVDQQNTFYSSLVALLCNDELRKTYANNALKSISGFYNLKVQSKIMIDTIKRVL